MKKIRNELEGIDNSLRRTVVGVFNCRLTFDADAGSREIILCEGAAGLQAVENDDGWNPYCCQLSMVCSARVLTDGHLVKQATIADPRSRPVRRRRWPRAVVPLFALTILAALFLGLWRDLPRRWVEGRLASMLDAEVWTERLDVDAPIREVLAGRFERLAVDGVDVRLVPAAQPTKPRPRSELQSGRIEIHRGRLGMHSGVDETRLEFAAVLTNWGVEPTGHLSFTAKRFHALPLLRIFGDPGQQPRAEEPAASPVVDATFPNTLRNIWILARTQWCAVFSRELNSASEMSATLSPVSP